MCALIYPGEFPRKKCNFAFNWINLIENNGKCRNNNMQRMKFNIFQSTKQITK